MYSEALHRAIVAVDVAGFSKKSQLAQKAVHKALQELLEKAFDEASIGWATCDVEDRGDGKLILVPPEVSKERIAEHLSSRLLAEVRRHNRIHAADAAIKLRVALHSGEVRESEYGKVGTAINLAFRILEAQQAKAALNQTDGVLALIASEQFYRDVVQDDPAALPDEFRKIAVSVKETEGVAWLRLPDFPASPGASVGEHDSVDDNKHVLGVLPQERMDWLRERLVGVRVPQLSTLVHRAGGLGVPPPPYGADAWGVFEHLADCNAGADGVPPALRFVELLARHVGGALGAKLTEWNDDQARFLGLETQVGDVRASAPPPVSVDSRLHLMIVVEPDGIDPDRYLVSHWRQDDPEEWPPARGESGITTSADLELYIDNLVVDAEKAWGDHDNPVALEFVLPRPLLNLPVHSWHKEHASEDPRPLCLDYPIVVRSLERIRSRFWHRAWRQRWQLLTADPSTALVCFAPPADSTSSADFAAVLAEEPRFVSAVLAAPPPCEGSRNDQLTAALRSGLPAVMWHSNGDVNSVHEVVSWMTEDGGLADLPARAQRMRINFLLAEDGEVVRNLIVMWDDPDRLPVLDELVG